GVPSSAVGTWGVPPRGRREVEAERVEAKLSYRSPAVGATVTRTEGGFRLRLDEQVYGVAPGPAAALYAQGAVVGAGRIRVDPAETVTPVSSFASEGA